MFQVICEECRYWNPAGGETGFCQRHAPQTIFTAESGQFTVRWPVTYKSDWCGDAQR